MWKYASFFGIFFGSSMFFVIFAGEDGIFRPRPGLNGVFLKLIGIFLKVDRSGCSGTDS